MKKLKNINTSKIRRTLAAIAFGVCGMVLLQSCDTGGNQTTSDNSFRNNSDTSGIAQNNNNNDMAQNGNNNGGAAEMENTDMVPSGTYTGIAQQVDPEEKEIYVRTNDNKTLELYFDEETELTQNGDTVSFDALEQGQRLEVTIENQNDQMQPVAVNILE